MILNELIVKALERGLLLRVLYSDNKKRMFKIIGKSKWLKKYKLKCVEGDIIDILRQKPTTLDNTIDTIEYLFMPKNFNLRYFLNTQETIDNHKELLTGTLEKLSNILLSYNEYKNILIRDLKQLSFKEIKDEFFVRFYPAKLLSRNKKQAINEIENDIIEKYFIIGHDIKEHNTIPACTRIGLSHLLVDTSDSQLVASCKRKWFNVIEFEKNNLISTLQLQLKKTRKRKLKNKSKAINQLKQYIKLLQRINIRSMRHCNTIKDIISFWPDIMQPAPPYIYEY